MTILIILGIYLLIGIVLAVWMYKETISHERWAVPFFQITFFWGFLVLARACEMFRSRGQLMDTPIAHPLNDPTLQCYVTWTDGEYVNLTPLSCKTGLTSNQYLVKDVSPFAELNVHPESETKND